MFILIPVFVLICIFIMLMVIPFDVIMTYDGVGVVVFLKVYWFMFRVFDSGVESKPKKPKPKKTKKPKKQKPTQKPKKPQLQDIINNFDLIKKYTLNIIKTTANALTIQKVDIDVVFGMDDPALTGITYGRVCAMGGILYDSVSRYVKKGIGMKITPVFMEKCFDLYILLDIRTSIIRLFMILFPVLRLIKTVQR